MSEINGTLRMPAEHVLKFQTSAEAISMGYGIKTFDHTDPSRPVWLVSTEGEEVRTWDPVQEYRAVIGVPPEVTVARLDQIMGAMHTRYLRKGERPA